MVSIYYFNPENDLALANGGLNYTAPPRAAQLRHDLRLLPAWLAQPGDRVLCFDQCTMHNEQCSMTSPDACKKDREWLLAQELGVDIITPSELPSLTEARLVPWGWSRATRRTLQRWGVPERLLPSAERIEAVHRLSHRRTTITIHEQLKRLTGTDYCPTPVELTTLEQVSQWAADHPGCYLKLPWSGSGQGVYRVLSMDDEHLWQWCRGGLRRQGSLLCEQALDKVLDFATEWLCCDGMAQLVGYSVFESDFHHQYQCGLVDSSQALHDRIAAQYAPIDDAVTALQEVITTLLAPHYDGYLGVDMLLYRRDDGTTGLDPCVEVNLRCTMGLVCSVLGERHGMRGAFSITDASCPDGRALTPPGTRFTARLVNTLTLRRDSVRVV